MEMHDKVKELTEKIHREGVEKANEEAKQIVEEAKKEAEKIVEKAKKDAEKRVADAEKKAEDVSQKIESEVRLSSQQALLNLKKEITDLVQAEVLKEPLEDAFKDSAFLRDILTTLVKNWNAADEAEEGLEVLLSADQLKKLEEYLKKKSGSVLNEGITLKEYPGVENGFEIQPRGGHYKITITDEAFEAFLGEHLKPKTMEFLFGGDQ